MMKLEKGDALEQNYFEFINDKLPTYEKIWGSYIGNNGHNNMIQVEVLPPKDNIKRQHLSEYLYTCLESIICMKEITRLNFNFEQLSIEKYLSILNNQMAFQANASRFRDNAKNLMCQYMFCSEVNSKIKIIKEIYDERCCILHGKKIPFILIEGKIQIPKKEYLSKYQNQIRYKYTWDNFDINEFEVLNLHLEKAFNEICEYFESILKEIWPYIEQIIEKYSINIDDIFVKNFMGSDYCPSTGISGDNSSPDLTFIDVYPHF